MPGHRPKHLESPAPHGLGEDEVEGLRDSLLLCAQLSRWLNSSVAIRRLARHLGPLHVETPPDAPPEYLAQARRVALAIARISPHTPWTSNCFPQALVAKYWLGRRHIPTTLYLGVALNKNDSSPTSEMTAHAWLRCGPLMVTGGRGHERYTVTARFGG